MKGTASSALRPPTRHEMTSFESASMPVHVHVSPAPFTFAAIFCVTFLFLA
jgi:hypothetical protein